MSSQPADEDDMRNRSRNRGASAAAEKAKEDGGTDKPSPGCSSKTLPNLFSRFVTSFEGALHSITESTKSHKLSDTSIEGVVEYIKKHKPGNIIVMTGAGISTSVGIPDFRSPGTGLYDNLHEHNLNSPLDVFSIDFFVKNPEPFFAVAKKLFPTNVKPSPTHHFVRLLEKKGILRRWYTQNVDSLEFATGIPEDFIVEAHGSHRKSTCLKCGRKFDLQWIERYLADENSKVPHCDKEGCSGIVKPDITFFGEQLPRRFFQAAISDFPKCDLLIIIGTSLVVQPFAGMIHEVGDDVPRLLINLEESGQPEISTGIEGLCYGRKDNTRDVFWKGTCDDGVRKLADLLNWELELESLIQEGEILHKDRRAAAAVSAGKK